MLPDESWAKSEMEARYCGYHRIFGSVSYLLVAVVFVDIALVPPGGSATEALLVFCALLLAYYWVTGRLWITPDRGRSRTLLDLFVLLVFVTATCFCTGQTKSPFYPLYYLILVAGALTQAKQASYILAAFSMGCAALLVAAEGDPATAALSRHLPEFVSFALITHVGAVLAGAAARARREMERLSLTDDLTSLHNMRSFHALAQQQEKMARRYAKPFSICMLDTDNLKQVNDRFGHLAGTELIKWTAHIIEKNIRECDVAARFGGDEFIILYSEHDKREIFPAVERIVRAVASTTFFFEGAPMTCTVSAGVASFPEDGTTLREVMARADLAVYQSKALGKNRAVIYGESGAASSPLAARRAAVAPSDDTIGTVSAAAD